MRKAAVAALDEPFDDDVIKRLLAILENSEDAICGSAAQALGPIADESILWRLTDKALQSNEMARNVAAGLALAKTETALLTLKAIMAKWPEEKNFSGYLGFLLQRLGHCDEAIDVLSKAIDKEERDAVPYLVRGFVHFAKENYEYAMTDFRRTIVLDPNWLSPWSGLGFALFETNHENEATQAWWRAKSLATGSADIFAQLGLGLWATGNQDEALRLWRRARTREPRFGQDWKWMQKEEMWGPRMIEMAKELAATCG